MFYSVISSDDTNCTTLQHNSGLLFIICQLWCVFIDTNILFVQNIMCVFPPEVTLI